MPNDVKKFVDEVFNLYPDEAPKMAVMARDGIMGFGGATDYGVIHDDRHDEW